MASFEDRLQETLSNAYDIERELGGGGMSRVFVATDRILKRKIVIKILSPELTADVNRGRFRREIQVAAQLQHPHIVTLLSAGEFDDLLYYTMPFIAGQSLKTAIEKNGPLPVEDVLRVLYDVGEAIDYAHAEGVVHRDIKPANILRSGNYSLITDFGVAKALNAAMPSSGMTSTGMAVGTPAYMAPEQLAGDSAADHRIDIYAVGLLAYELLNGRSPFAANSPQRVLAAVLTQDPLPLINVRPDIPTPLSDLVMQCLSKEPDQRPPTAKALLDQLDIFSTASGEIRTMEHRLPRSERKTPRAAVPVTTPHAPTDAVTVNTPHASTDAVSVETPRIPTTEVPFVPSLQETVAVEHQTTPVEPQSAEVDWPSYEESKRTKKSRTKLIGALAFLIPVAAGAIYLSRSGGSATAVVPPTDSVAAVDSASKQALSPVAPSDSAAMIAASGTAIVAPPVDSQKVADSIKKARREAAKKAIAAAESVRKASEANAFQAGAPGTARRAATAMLSDENARKQFTRGATHMGGVLGTQRKGDLQTQIDALTPFLTRAGLTYDHFKLIVQQAGVTLFDEYGRMRVDSLQKFASQGQ
jgi:serine/threonine protein kinase